MSACSAFERLRAHALDPRTGFSLGIFGAVAEFMRDVEEPTAIRDTDPFCEIVTARGGIRIARDPQTVLVAYEMPSRHAEKRIPAEVACLPAKRAARAGRRVVHEIGPDTHALRPEHRDALLFDLGIGLDAVEACVRTADPDLIAVLRRAEGRALFEAKELAGAMLAFSPHRVFVSALGRIEVFQPIPPPGGRSPDGPHTHVLPKLIAHQRTHAATVPVPDGFAPCLSVHPPEDSRLQQNKGKP